MPRPPVALYVHVPFCVSLCPYCDFVVLSGAAARGPRNRLEAWYRAVLAELELRADAQDRRSGQPNTAARPPLASVYLGGGTPSLLPAAWVGRLLERVDARFGMAADAEVTLEANPGENELGDLQGFRSAGVGRLSIGAQSLDVAELKRLGRRHRPSDVAAAIEAARGAGFDRISVDLLYDVPGQTAETWRRTLDGVLTHGVDHVSAYALSLDDPEAEGLTGPLGDHLPVREGARRWRGRARAEQDEDRAAALYAQADETLGAAGLGWYEVSNWARPGHTSRHNLAYWLGHAYEAVGPGAHAYDGALTRRWNAARLDGYVGALATTNGRVADLPPGGEERLDPVSSRAERVILALRTSEGVPASFADDGALAPGLAWGRDQGLLERIELPGGAPRLRLTTRGRLLGNELFVRLLPPQVPGAPALH